MKKKLKTKSFFDLSDTEKKEVIAECAKDSNKMQKKKIIGWSRSKQKGSWSTRAVYEK